MHLEPALLNHAAKVLGEYDWLGLLLMIAAVVLLITFAAYRISGRALDPIAQLSSQADAMDPSDLTARFRVPPTGDETARLAESLNAMLTRIEVEFRSIEAFTADASHELRAPLALILMAGEVALRRERSREELSEFLRKIVREARYMSKLVEDLLDTAREGVDAASALAPVDLREMLRELQAEFTPAAAMKGLTLTADIPAQELLVLGESTALRRLFLILLDNAIKYTETGSVRVSLNREGSHVSAKISDTGIGMEKSALPHIFDRFWRADKGRSRPDRGTGLGLSMALQIVERLGGSIAVESEFGRGTSFTVQLRAATAFRTVPYQRTLSGNAKAM